MLFWQCIRAVLIVSRYIGDAFESYEHALIADVPLGEATDSGGMDSLYYNLDGYFVNEQESYHGNKYGG